MHQGFDAGAHRKVPQVGNVVIGGNFVVGLVVFVILMIINFVVVTKGSERISEVSARFTLDALPGKEREVFVLHRMEGRTLLQVGEQTGLSMFQVRKLVERAMTRLARKVWKD